MTKPDIPTQRSSQTLTWLLCLLAVVVILGWTRLWWFSSSVPEGWSTAVGSFSEQVLGKLIDTRPRTQRMPQEEYDFWQPRIARVLADHPTDAELYAAAAVMMDKPSEYVFSQTATAMLETKTQPFWGGEAVFDRVADRLAEFDVLATPQSLAFAKRATELEPDDPRWWRLCVALTTTPIGYPEDHVDRQTDLERLVVDAAKHDPDNGVYGLLIAAAMVDTAIGFDDKRSLLVIQDRHSLDAAVLQAIEAIQKPNIAIGEPAIDGVQRLHELVGQTGRGTIQSLQSHSTGQRALPPIVTLARTMIWAGEVCERQNEPEQAAEFYDVGLQIADAVLVKGDPQLRNQGALFFVRSHAYRRKLTLQQKTPAELTLDSPAGRAFVAEQAFKAAVARSQRMPPTVHWFYIVAGMVSASMLVGCLCWLPVGLVGYVANRKSSPFTIPWWTWLVGAGALTISVVFWGIGPAGHISITLQNWLLNIAVAVGLFVAMVGSLRRVQGKLQYRLRTLIALPLVAAVGTQAGLYFGFGLPAPIAAEPNGLLANLQQWTSTDLSTWLPGSASLRSSIVQWMFQKGPVVTIWLTIAMVLLIRFYSLRLRAAWGQTLAWVCVVILVGLAVWPWGFAAQLPGIALQNQIISQYLTASEEYYRDLDAEFESERQDAANQQLYLQTARDTLADF